MFLTKTFQKKKKKEEEEEEEEKASKQTNLGKQRSKFSIKPQYILQDLEHGQISNETLNSRMKIRSFK